MVSAQLQFRLLLVAAAAGWFDVLGTSAAVPADLEYQIKNYNLDWSPDIVMNSANEATADSKEALLFHLVNYLRGLDKIKQKHLSLDDMMNEANDKDYLADFSAVPMKRAPEAPVPDTKLKSRKGGRTPHVCYFKLCLFRTL